MRIIIETIPHEKQRYETCGDWFYNYQTDELRIYVSILENWKQEMGVAIHELVESLLCMSRGIKESDVTNFDINYERMRPKGDLSEPGDCSLAPYHREHSFATGIERIFCNEIGVRWDEYENKINSLSQPVPE